MAASYPKTVDVNGLQGVPTAGAFADDLEREPGDEQQDATTDAIKRLREMPPDSAVTSWYWNSKLGCFEFTLRLPNGNRVTSNTQQWALDPFWHIKPCGCGAGKVCKQHDPWHGPCSNPKGNLVMEFTPEIVEALKKQIEFLFAKETNAFQNGTEYGGQALSSSPLSQFYGHLNAHSLGYPIAWTTGEDWGECDGAC